MSRDVADLLADLNRLDGPDLWAQITDRVSSFELPSDPDPDDSEEFLSHEERPRRSLLVAAAVFVVAAAAVAGLLAMSGGDEDPRVVTNDPEPTAPPITTVRPPTPTTTEPPSATTTASVETGLVAVDDLEWTRVEPEGVAFHRGGRACCHPQIDRFGDIYVGIGDSLVRSDDGITWEPFAESEPRLADGTVLTSPDGLEATDDTLYVLETVPGSSEEPFADEGFRIWILRDEQWTVADHPDWSSIGLCESPYIATDDTEALSVILCRSQRYRLESDGAVTAIPETRPSPDAPPLLRYGQGNTRFNAYLSGTGEVTQFSEEHHATNRLEVSTDSVEGETVRVELPGWNGNEWFGWTSPYKGLRYQHGVYASFVYRLAEPGTHDCYYLFDFDDAGCVRDAAYVSSADGTHWSASVIDIDIDVKTELISINITDDGTPILHWWDPDGLMIAVAEQSR